MAICAAAIGTLGLLFDIAGIWLLYCNGGIGYPSTLGQMGVSPQERRRRTRLARVGAVTATVGFFLQGVALWVASGVLHCFQ